MAKWIVEYYNGVRWTVYDTYDDWGEANRVVASLRRQGNQAKMFQDNRTLTR